MLLNIWPNVGLLWRPQVREAHAVITEVLKVWSGLEEGHRGSESTLTLLKVLVLLNR